MLFTGLSHRKCQPNTMQREWYKREYDKGKEREFGTNESVSGNTEMMSQTFSR